MPAARCIASSIPTSAAVPGDRLSVPSSTGRGFYRTIATGIDGTLTHLVNSLDQLPEGDVALFEEAAGDGPQPATVVGKA
jgi:hypothetical protein